MKKRTTRLLALFLALLLMVSGCTLPVKLTNGRNPFRLETPSATTPSGSQELRASLRLRTLRKPGISFQSSVKSFLRMKSPLT